MNNKNVFILGAGFSNPVGLPSISEFYNLIKIIYLDKKHELNDFLSKSFEGVIEYRNTLNSVSAKTTIDLDNIETLFSYLDMDCECGDGACVEIRRKLVYTIINTLDISTKFSYVDALESTISIKDYLGKENVRFGAGKETNFNLNIYEYFACLISGIIGSRDCAYTDRDTIITFNYDIILDSIFLAQHIPVFYGFGENKKGDIRYLKLHGSANWSKCNECGKIKVIPVYPKDLLKCDTCADAILEPLIVPPTWNKSEYRNEINEIWKTALEEIKKARKIFIIGYSRPNTDLFFEYLMSLGLKDNNDIEKIVVVDRDVSLERASVEKEEIKFYLEELDKKYKSLLNSNFIKNRHYEFRAIGVEDFIRTYLPSYLGFRKS